MKPIHQHEMSHGRPTGITLRDLEKYGGPRAGEKLGRGLPWTFPLVWILQSVARAAFKLMSWLDPLSAAAVGILVKAEADAALRNREEARP